MQVFLLEKEEVVIVSEGYPYYKDLLIQKTKVGYLEIIAAGTHTTFYTPRWLVEGLPGVEMLCGNTTYTMKVQ